MQESINDFLRQITPGQWLAIIGVGIGLMFIARPRRPVIKSSESKHIFIKTIWRFCTGAHLDGQIKTDAGWWTKGARDLTPAGKAARWCYLPRAWRAGIRLAACAAASWLAWARFTGSEAPAVIGWAVLVVAILIAAWKIPSAIRERRHIRRYVIPIHKALAGHLGVSDSARPTSWISVPRRFRENGATTRLLLPATWPDTPQIRQAINTAVTTHLRTGLHEFDVTYTTDIPTPVVTFTKMDAADRYFRVVRNQQNANKRGDGRAAI